MSYYDFTYLVEKIKAQNFDTKPFKHVYIDDFFSNEHFEEIIKSNEISSPIASNDKELIGGLLEKGFKPIPFPGCDTNIKKYIKWHRDKKSESHHTACEGFGMAFRLYQFPSRILKELNQFITSKEFNYAIAKKFDINFDDCVIDGGIQKYLDGYEISPHPDVRRKATTFMININPSDKSEQSDHHTHYLKLKKSYKYVEEFWKGNENVDRAWVPWSWAETIKQQTKNNSIVLFSPSNDTLHGVKASYNHLETQRTQLYGNLWYKENKTNKNLEWEQLDLSSQSRKLNVSSQSRKLNVKENLKKLIPANIKSILKKLINNNPIGDRKSF